MWLQVDLYDADPATLNNAEGLRKDIEEIIKGAGMHLLSIHASQLEPQGVTVVAGISESHLTIHTWPENGAALIDLFTCGDSANMLAILPDMVRFAAAAASTALCALRRAAPVKCGSRLLLL